ncbi:peptidoglycan branched peptide synthesis protein [Streptococcus agalactiae LMG 14747]|uniref:Aminoacyltransferase FemA n=2 Tax=Streptococcus TaxID=1301 RepID=V6Z167_STRAG|nr:aminoacyltransferase [Streptococcus acidominimus]ESV54488.1 peptidoglycan branched peptide synthesis protein [Streptococcus agalactiae LMG 14747]SNV44579.1 FemAB family protein [Streptococcus acidominimus]
MVLVELSKEDYSSALSQFSEVSFTQSLEMAELLRKRGFNVRFMGLEADGAIQVAGLLYSKAMAGGQHMEMNTGPACRDLAYLKAFYQELQAFAKKNGALELIIKPYDTYQEYTSEGEPAGEERRDLLVTLTDLGFQHDGLQTGYPGGEPDWLYVKSLDGLTAQNLRKSFSKKGKPLANKAASFGTKLRRLKRSELPIFKEITSSTSERRDYSDKSLHYYEDFYDAFGDNCEFMVAEINFQDYLTNLQKDLGNLELKLSDLEEKLAANPDSRKYQNMTKEYQAQAETFEKRISEAKELIAEHGSEDVVMAGSLFVYTAREAIYLFSGSYTEFNKFYAPVALQEHVMLEAIRRGIPTYNFLGIQGVFDGSDGVLRFKQNFNGSIVRKMGTFRYYPRPLKKKAIDSVKKLLGRS